MNTTKQNLFQITTTLAIKKAFTAWLAGRSTRFSSGQVGNENMADLVYQRNRSVIHKSSIALVFLGSLVRVCRCHSPCQAHGFSSLRQGQLTEA